MLFYSFIWTVVDENVKERISILTDRMQLSVEKWDMIKATNQSQHTDCSISYPLMEEETI